MPSRSRRGRALRWVGISVALALSATGCLRTLPVDPSVLGGQALTSQVLATDGTLITTLHAEIDRRPLTLDEIPQVVVDAVLAIEDRRFYAHDGVDVRGIARAAGKNVRDGALAQGGSTITQQLVKNTLVTPERTLNRKVREAALAVGLERALTKDQILERYLNTVYFGQGAYGVGAAVRVYFGHGPEEVSLAEAALLAGLIRSPNTADPVQHPKAATARRSTVLDAMVETKAISAAEADEARSVAVPRKAHRDNARYPAAYAVADAVATLLDDERLGATPAERQNALFRGGLTVRLTIDLEQQRIAEESVAAVLTSPADPDAALAAVKPGDGAITAMVGGPDFFSNKDPQAKVNLARGGSTKRQAGSTFKVFTLLAALEKGITLGDTFEAGAQAVLPCQCPKPWTVDNYEGSAFGRISLREATESSVNTAYARVVERIGGGDVDKGTAAVVAVAERLGVRGAKNSRLRREPAVTLGAQEVDPVQMAAAYAAIAAGGTYAKPYLVAEVKDSNGRVVLRNKPQRSRAIAPGIALIATDALQGVVEKGTGVKARQATRPVAGKTGTSTAYHDAWFVGFTPGLAAAVWLGEARKQVSMIPEKGYRTIIAGGTFPALIWGRFARAALSGTPVQQFGDIGGASIKVKVDESRGGCLPNQFTLPEDIVERTFIKGTQPTKVCTEPRTAAATVVPALLGMQVDFATQTLQDVGFDPLVQMVYDPRYPAGVVVGQQPASGTKVAPGSRVTVQVSGGSTVTVPDVLGLDTESAKRQLAAAGLVADVVLEPSCIGGASCEARLEAEAGRVWRQDVRAGRSVKAGSVVRIAVGPRYTPAPSPPPPASYSPSPTASPSGTGAPPAG